MSCSRIRSALNAGLEKKLVFLEELFRFLVFLKLFLVLMYEDWTQNNDTARIARNSRYITHPFPCHIIHSHAQTIAQL